MNIIETNYMIAINDLLDFSLYSFRFISFSCITIDKYLFYNNLVLSCLKIWSFCHLHYLIQPFSFLSFLSNAPLKQPSLMGHLAHNHFFLRLLHSRPVNICMYANDSTHNIFVWLLSVFTNVETF